MAETVSLVNTLLQIGERRIKTPGVFSARVLSILLLLGGGCHTPPPKPAPPPPKPIYKPKPKPEITIPKEDEDIPAPECAERDKELAQLYEPFHDAFRNLGLEISSDGSKLLFLSNREDKSFQLYIAERKNPKSTPTIIAEAKDAVESARFTPDGKMILFTRAKNKNENTQIYRATVDGQLLKPLTDNPLKFHTLPMISADGKTLIYFRGDQKKGDFELVSQSIDGKEIKSIKTFRGFHVLSDLSRDGSRALVYTLISLSQSKLMIVDLKSGAVKNLAPLKNKKSHAHRALFSADEKSVIFITDENSARAGLQRLDLESGKVVATYNPQDAEVRDIEISKTGSALAVLLDMGSHHTIRLLEPQSLKTIKAVRHPRGTFSLGRFTADGRSLVVNFSTPSSPTGAYELTVRNGRLRLLRKDRRPHLKRNSRVKASVVKIASFDGLEVPCNLYLPYRLPRRKKLPVLVKIHGGPASSSAIGWSPMVSFWISRGFAVLEPNVRGSTGFGKSYEQADNGDLRMNAVKDLESVNEWIRKQPWADVDRIAIFGGSYGGYMTYMAVGHQPSLWRAGIGLVGVVNLVTFLKHTTGAIRLILRDEFGQLPEDKAFLKNISPISVVAKIKAPLFVYQGEHDPRVPRSEQDQLVHSLRLRNIPVEYMVATHEGHSLAQKRTIMQFIGRSMRFLEQYLDLPGLPEDCKALVGTTSSQ